MAKKKSNTVREAEYEEIEVKSNKTDLDDDYLEEEVEDKKEEKKKVKEKTTVKKEVEEKEEEIVKEPMSEKTRMIILGIVAVALLAAIIVFAVVDSKSSATDKKTNNVVSEVKKGDERNTSTDFLKKLYEVVDSKNTKVIFFESATCGYCTMEKPIIKNIATDYEMEYFDIDASTLKDEEITEIVETFGIQGATPTIIITKAGKIVAINEGYLDGKELVNFFATNGVLKADAVYKQEENLTEIDYAKFKSLASKDKYSVVLLDTSACGNCNTVREILSGIAKDKKIDVYHMAAASLSEDDVNDLVGKKLKDMGYDESSYKKDGTVNVPLTLIVKNNKIKKYILDKTEKSDYTKALKKLEIIK